MVTVTVFDVSTVTPSVPSAVAANDAVVLVSEAGTDAMTCCARGMVPPLASTVAGAKVMAGSDDEKVRVGLYPAGALTPEGKLIATPN